MAASKTQPPPAPSKLTASLQRVLGKRFSGLLQRFGAFQEAEPQSSLIDLATALMTLRSHASGPALASAFFQVYEASDRDARQAFLLQFPDHFPLQIEAIDRAVAKWINDRDAASGAALHEATASPCETLLHRLNQAPEGLRRLLAMRVDLLGIAEKTPGLRGLDDAFQDAFSAWFNVGLLELRAIHWNSPAALLERIIKYEAVHAIQGWTDLNRRVEPVDRRCYGFFHPQLADEPLIFVEVALTDQLPRAIDQIIANERAIMDPQTASSAIFYSISNCQDGLRGIPFGDYLIKRVVGLLKEDLPHLATFATLSPLPGFAKWLAAERADNLRVLAGDGLRVQAARYLLRARSPSGQVLDPVARFHLGNGARLEAVHADADRSTNGMNQSHGVMVNYLYVPDDIEANLLTLAEEGTVAASKDVRALVKED